MVVIINVEFNLIIIRILSCDDSMHQLLINRIDIRIVVNVIFNLVDFSKCIYKKQIENDV